MLISRTGKPVRSQHRPPKGKPGPVAVSPSNDDRRRVEIGIGGGLSAAALARLFGISRRTFNRLFAAEIEVGRAKVTLEMLLCLYRAARKGNAAAAKALLQFIERSAKPDPESVPDNRWEGLAERVHYCESGILPENGNFKLDS